MSRTEIVKKNNQILLRDAFLTDQKAIMEDNQKIKKELFRKSIKIYKNILKNNKNNLEALRGLGRSLLHSLSLQEALSVYKKGLGISKLKNRHVFYNGLGSVYKYMADYSRVNQKLYMESAKIYEAAIKKAPKAALGIYYSNLSTAYAGLKNWQQAIKTSEKAIRLLKMSQQKLKINYGNQIKILKLENKLYREYKKRTLF